MSAVAKHSEQPVALVSDSATILQIISRAASDPAVDMDKMERLMAMHERIVARTAHAAYTAALALMQPELPIITERGAIKNRESQVQSTYAKWEDINEAIKPILARHGFALSFKTGDEGGKVKVTGILGHKDGHSEETSMLLPADTSGSKNAVQALGSSTSYGKRYTASALLNLTSRGEDDDGKKGGAGETISEEQEANIKALMEEVGADRKRFLEYLKVDALEEILARNYTTVIKMLEAKRRK